MIDLGTLIHDALERNASDIHLTVGEPPVFRLDGELTNFGEVPLTEADTTAYVQELITPGLLKEFHEMGEADFAVTYHDLVRMRCNVFRQRGMTSLALRLLPLRIATAEELGLPPVVVAQADKPRGLVLVTGPTGSGKSSTLAALLDHINHTERRHIITLEEPIEYLHTSDQCIINQREVGADTSSFAAGLRAALRQDPDVILVGEMRDLETISTAITAAETGHLVFGTLHTKGAANTIDRIIDSFPAEQQNQIRIQLADVLECARGPDPPAEDRRRPHGGIRDHDRHPRHSQHDPAKQDLPDRQRHPDRQAVRDAAFGRRAGGSGRPSRDFAGDCPRRRQRA